MAGHLAGAGHDVTVYNRTASKAQAWIDHYGHGGAGSPADAADGAELVMVCVGGDDDVRQVTLGEAGALTSMRPGTILVDHTTTSATLARELGAAAAAAGVGFVDGPVSGGQAGAEGGTLTVMCGCDDESVFDRASVAIAAYAKRCVRMGGVGAGQLTKMANQVCIAGTLQGLAEAVHLAQRVGLDVEQLVEVLSGGAAQSWQLENRAMTMSRGQFEFGFAVEWMRKDLGFVLDEARRLDVPVPLTALVAQLYALVAAHGGRRWDTSSLIHLLQTS